MTDFKDFEDLRRLYRRISSRIKNIESTKRDLIEQSYSAANTFNELVEKYGAPKKSMDDKTLRTYYRDLKYIDNLKTSTVKGATETHEMLKDFYGMYGALSDETQDKFWSVYKQLYERTGGLIERYKYEVFDTAIMDMFSGDSVENIVENLYKLYLPQITDTTSTEEDENGLKLPYA